jgi:hypothetical protein
MVLHAEGKGPNYRGRRPRTDVRGRRQGGGPLVLPARHPARSRDWTATSTVANSCSSSMTATFPRIPPSC